MLLLRGNITAPYSLLRRESRENDTDLFFPGIKRQDIWEWLKVVPGIFRPDIGKHFSIELVVKHWIRLPRETVNSPSQIKRHLDNALSNII